NKFCAIPVQQIHSFSSDRSADSLIAGRLSATQAPRREDHVLPAFWRGTQNCLDSIQKRDDGERIFSTALRGDYHDRVALLQIGKRRRRHARNHLLKVCAGAGAGAGAARTLLSTLLSASRASLRRICRSLRGS